MTWSNSLIENVICVDEVEIKYWEEGAFSKGYHKESIKITNAGIEDYEYMVSGKLFLIHKSSNLFIQSKSLNKDCSFYLHLQ